MKKVFTFIFQSLIAAVAMFAIGSIESIIEMLLM